MSKAEEELLTHMKAEGVPTPDREYKFSRDIVGDGPGIRQRLKDANLKDWRFDFAWPNLKLAVEVEGGLYIGGRHSRGAGYEGDLMKYQAAMRNGWTVYRCSPRMIKQGAAIDTIKILLASIDL